MSRFYRPLVALAALVMGLSLLPHTGLFAGVVNWRRFAGGYEDAVTVTRARYRDRDGGELEVRAYSSAGGAAILDVFRTADNSFIGRLTFEGNDHRGEWEGIGPFPQVITVRSTLGGWSTVLTLFDDSGVPLTVTPSPVSITQTPVPGASNTPTGTPVPGATSTPTGTPVAGATSTPTGTTVPGATSTPTGTTAPGATSTPTGTIVPGATSTPTGTTVPGGMQWFLPIVSR